MNLDAKSTSPSGDADSQTRNDSKTTDRRTPICTLPADAEEGATFAADWCAWCGRNPSTDEDLDVDDTWPSAGDDDERRRRPSYDQLRFCSRSCLSRYKMDLFCRETQRNLQHLQGSDRLSSCIGSDDAKEQRILITPELWSQPAPGDDNHSFSVDPRTSCKDSSYGGAGPRQRQRSDGDRSSDDMDASITARQKLRKINVSDRLVTSRKSTINSSDDCLRGTQSRTPVHKDATATGATIKLESGGADAVLGGSRPLASVNLPWLPPTSIAVSSSLTSPFTRGFFTSPLWPHATPSFPPAQVRPPPPPPPFAAAASIPLGFGAPGWPPGLVPPPAMFVPYPIPIPLPLPLPIPVPIPIKKLSSELSTEVCGDKEMSESNSQTPSETNSSSGKSKGDRSDDRRTTSESVTPKSFTASSSALSSDAWNVLDLSTGASRCRSTELSSTKVSWTDAVTAPVVGSTVDASPYLARRSLILDAPAPAADRKSYGGDQAGGGRTSSLSAVGKRFNHHRRRATPIPLVKSK